jgi:hypothetical protein
MRTKRMFFSIAKFVMFCRFWNTYESNESHSLENCRVKVSVLESESVSESGKKISGSESEKKIFRILNTEEFKTFNSLLGPCTPKLALPNSHFPTPNPQLPLLNFPFLCEGIKTLDSLPLLHSPTATPTFSIPL